MKNTKKSFWILVRLFKYFKQSEATKAPPLIAWPKLSFGIWGFEKNAHELSKQFIYSLNTFG